jgi:hyaluronoglucosaminidase
MSFFDNAPKDFQVYWNVPTFMCHKYGMDFREVSKKFGIVQNDQDKFRGEEIVILYDPGNFPALLKDNKGNEIHFNLLNSRPFT